MNHERVRNGLHDYVDRSLDSSATEAVERHLLECESCREEARRLESVVVAVRTLSPSIEPRNDLWPAIDSRIESRGVRERSLWSVRYTLAAAAVVLVVASSTVSWWFARNPALSTAGPAITQFMGTELEYVRAVAVLQDEWSVTENSLTPEVRAVIDRNLRVIDEAIRETRAALVAYPQNVDIVEILSGIYRKKLDVLLRATRMSFES